MTFDDLPLYVAIHHVREHMKANNEKPGADAWTNERAVELTQMIAEALITKPNPLYIEAWRKFRKGASATKGDEEKKFDIIAKLCELYGAKCFYEGRGIGDCSDEVDLDRIKAGGEYSIANCILSCSYHNRSRGDQDFADFCNGSVS